MRAIYLATSVVAAVCFIQVPVASAQVLSISVGQTTVSPGGFADLDVLLTGSGDALARLGFEFRIVPVGGATSQLRFSEEAEDFLNDNAYVFHGNSTAFTDGLPSSVGTVSTTAFPNDTFTGGDMTANGDNENVGVDQLLVRLRVQHDPGLADPLTTLGQLFGIALQPSSGDSSLFSTGQSNTGFLDNALVPISFQSSAGLVTVASVAIPEPASFSGLAMATLTMGPVMMNRRRRISPDA